ncbi:ankyrin repeat and SAM domain-containing protein 3 isoform X3 [Papio anubis]|uniref:ankyrin repeat and SAM domain-containing protein 3 isoform X3 n=1 Tax=Papio anubis TaxID=9555 RepID=UPI0012AD891D|nr:ankyrin repeat and SAM domain-containing protein 3 isoform X3 [Papio anubis]
MSELSDEASEPELLNRSLSMWHGLGAQVSREELDVPLDLHTAASIGQYEVVKECVQRRELDLNKKNGGGWTPLMYASYIGHDTIVHLLLEAGVSVNVPTPEGQTPLMLASSCGNESIAYFLLQQGAELEMKDIQGWTALFHCTSAGHQHMVRFLLDSGANANVREPIYGFTPLMEAAAAGHEIIVQYFLNHGVKVDARDHSGATARMLAKQYGHMKIVALMDTHSPSLPKSLYRSPEKYEDLSSSDESCPAPQRQRPCRKKGVSIHEGPRALARITGIGLGGRAPRPRYEQAPPRGYVTFNSSGENPLEEEGLCCRDVTSPINERDVESSSSSSSRGPKECPGGGGSARGTPMHSTAVRPAGGRPVFPPSEEHAFCANLEPVQSSSSSEGLARAQGLSSEASVESNEVRILSHSPIAGPWPGYLTSPSYFKMRMSVTSTCYTCVPHWDVLCPGPGFSDDSERTGSPCVAGGGFHQGSPVSLCAPSDTWLSPQDSDHACKSSARKQAKSYMKTKNPDSQWPPRTGTDREDFPLESSPQTQRAPYSGPQDLATLLEQIGCLKYLQVFEEQDVDLRIFLTLTESDLKEIGITLFGPKRKMTSAIARWHSSARPPGDALELAYADRLEAEMQELAIQLHKRCEEVEAMRGQVCQEQELRAVVESCLLEQDRAREDLQAHLQETWALARDAALVLDQLRACQAELSSRVRRDHPPGAATLGPGLPAADAKGWQVSLQAMSLPELSGALEDRVHEMESDVG